MTAVPAGGHEAEFEVTVNGESRLLRPGTTVKNLVATVGTPERGVAVAVDGQVVPRSEWAVVQLRPGAVVEIVTAAAGG